MAEVLLIVGIIECVGCWFILRYADMLTRIAKNNDAKIDEVRKIANEMQDSAAYVKKSLEEGLAQLKDMR